MNESTGNMASGAFEKPEGRETLLTLTTARRMVPLVGKIVGEIGQTRQLLARLKPEQDRLDRNRRSLTWPERSRRYQLREEIDACEQQLLEANAELEILGVVMVNPDTRWIGFPTLVNGRPAFFSWIPGEEGLHYWHFADETNRRLIPNTWARADETSMSGKG